MITITVRWYGELNDGLPAEHQYTAVLHHVEDGAAAGDLAAASGVSVESIDLILANGVSVDPGYRVRENDRIAFFPVFESFDISAVTAVRERPLRRPAFVLDVHLGKLARHLRMIGFDTLYRNDYTDATLCELSLREHRTLLSKDRTLIATEGLTRAYLVRNSIPRLQLVEVLDRFQLFSGTDPFTRCIECNTVLQFVDKAGVYSRIPENVITWCDEYLWCSTCDRIYWKGSHYKRMQEYIAGLPQR